MPTYTTNDIFTNRLDKKINYGKARTDFDDILSPTSESIPSPIPNPSHDLWIDSHLIPTTAPSSNSNIIHVHKHNPSVNQGTSVGQSVGVIEMTRNPTVSSQRSWVACSTPGQMNTRLDRWIRTTYGATYLNKFAIATAGGGNGNYDITQRAQYFEIFPNTTNEQFYFDTEAGVLVMYGNPNGSVKSHLTDQVSGSYVYSIYMIQGYRYWDTNRVGIQNYNPTASGTNLGQLGDVNISNPADGHIIIYDSTANSNNGGWVNSTNSAAGGSGFVRFSDLGVTTEGSPTDDGQISYNSNTGQFTYSPPDAFQGATNISAGSAGFVPQPASNVTDKFLKSDGTFADVHVADEANFMDGGSF